MEEKNRLTADAKYIMAEKDKLKALFDIYNELGKITGYVESWGGAEEHKTVTDAVAAIEYYLDRFRPC